MPLIFPAFDRHPEEASIIGRLLAVYGDMETDLMFCAAAVHDLDMAIKSMFRPRGESTCVDIADSLARADYTKVGLGTEFSEAIGNFRFCLRVRNQYAHCNWFDSPAPGLGFIDMEDMATPTKHLSMVDMVVYPVDVPLLKAQSDYFGYVQECLRYLANAYARKTGQKVAFELSKPKKVQQPIQHKLGIRPFRPTPSTPSGTMPA